MYDEYVDDDIDYESSLREMTRITTLKYLDISYMRCVSKIAAHFHFMCWKALLYLSPFMSAKPLKLATQRQDLAWNVIYNLYCYEFEQSVW